MSNSNSSIPSDGLAGLKQNFSKDALSGFLVFLLALPLSLGIAKASDFPAIFGVVTAIIGGVVVSFFAGSRLTIKGPAAGLIVIVSGCVSAYGGGEEGWKLALGAIVVAGVIQIMFGILKLGRLADFFPGAAIHGMLAAIGVIIMSKQIHTLLGIDPKHLKGKEPLELLAMIPESITHLNIHLASIGIICLVVMFLFTGIKISFLKKIPAPLIVLLFAIPMGFVMDLKNESGISGYSLVKIGNIFDNFKNGIINADFSGFSVHSGVFIRYVILFSLIGTLESLLTAKAIDGLDPYKRKSDFNKDITAVGIGNTLAGLLGGLPMISEVARSSANVNNGAQTRWANFFHGLFLLLAVVFAAPLIEMIPNSALAAMLIFVGFRLAHPREFKHMFHVGKEQLLIFVATIFITVATDLLIGVGSGILLELIVNIINGAPLKNLFKAEINSSPQNDHKHEIKVSGALIFSNNLSLKKAILGYSATGKIHIDLSQCKLVDHSSLETLNELKRDVESSGGSLIIEGIENHKALGHDNTSSLKKN